MKKLTAAQQATYLFIVEYWQEHGQPPSTIDIANRFSISNNAANSRVRAMRRKGALEPQGKLYPTGMRAVISEALQSFDKTY